MKFINLSFNVSEDTPLYGGAEGKIKFTQTASINKGDTCNNSEITMPCHSGTHIDFPLHFNTDGKSLEDYPDSFWYFEKIGFLNCNIENVLEEINYLDSGIEILILKTGFGLNRGDNKYWQNQPVIPSDFANQFREKFKNLRVFGFDLISLTSKKNREEGKKAHVSFLINNEILVVEDMNLSDLVQTPDGIIIAPLKIFNIDGVPCNVICYFN